MHNKQHTSVSAVDSVSPSSFSWRATASSIKSPSVKSASYACKIFCLYTCWLGSSTPSGSFILSANNSTRNLIFFSFPSLMGPGFGSHYTLHVFVDMFFPDVAGKRRKKSSTSSSDGKWLLTRQCIRPTWFDHSPPMPRSPDAWMRETIFGWLMLLKAP